jgi:hypothetical protein
MADQNFPGFEDDDEEKKPAAPKQAAPKPAAPAKPATGKVAKGDAQPPQLKEAGKVDYAFEESAEEEPKPKKPHAPAPSADTAREPTPATMRPAVGKPGAKPAPPPDEEPVDPDLKPGSRKDLWNCPHCGAGNKPGRPTCRTCGKSPDDPIEAPWFKKPAGIGGLAGGVALLIVIIVIACRGPDLTQHPAEAGAIDSKPRIGGSAEGTRDVSGKNFTAKKKFFVVGRCLGSAPSSTLDGTTTMVLVLGSAGKAELPAEAAASFNGDITDAPGVPSGSFIIVHLLNGKQQLKKGDVISIAGDTGELDGNSWSSSEYVVWPESVQLGQ